MTEEAGLDLWKKIDLGKVQTQQSSSEEPAEKKPKKTAPRWAIKTAWWILDLLCAGIWVFSFIKLFVADVDRVLVDAIAPSMRWLVDYRILVLLGLLSIVTVVFKRKYFWIPLYLLFFPIIFVAWKIPRFFYKRRSWVLVLGALQVVVTLIRGFKFTLIATTLAAIAIVIIIVSDTQFPLYTCGVLLLILWTAYLYRAVRYAFTQARFVRSQNLLLKKILGSKNFWKFVSVDPSMRSTDIVKLTPEQSNQALMKVGTGLAAYRASQFWAYRIDEYRRSPASYLFGFIAIIGLMVQALIIFTFVNLALFKAAPQEFSVSAGTSHALFAHYTFYSMYVSQVSEIVPKGALAGFLQVAAGFSAALIVLVLVVTIFFGYRESRYDQTAMDTIGDMRKQADQFATRFSTEYRESVDEVARRLATLGWDLFGLLGYLSRNIPEPPLEDKPHA
ncbi:MAG TPA: hypothetical protein VF557_15720 [Jatrophihabitans sp.]|jgi:hypothetical protein|uniref:hypothetical protein n=1 Tax=Jatrophihabitans sp. TaxID=1932789 RepID=UPI002F1CF167